MLAAEDLGTSARWSPPLEATANVATVVDMSVFFISFGFLMLVAGAGPVVVGMMGARVAVITG